MKGQGFILVLFLLFDIDLFYQIACDYEPFLDKSNILLVTKKIHKKIHSNNNSVYKYILCQLIPYD